MSHEALETPAAPQPEPKPTPPKKRGRGWMIAVGLVVVAIVGATVASKFPGRDTKRPTPTPDPVPVSAQPVEKKNIPIQIRAIGNVEASSTVQIRSLVSGELLKVHFAEGQTVKKGEPLFTLDQRPFEAALEQAQANLAKDQAQEAVAQAVLDRDLAQLNNAKKQAERYQELLKQGVVSQELSDQYRLNVETASAVVEADKASLNNVQSVLKADQAAIENAKIQLSYTKIQSPMDGRTGNLMVYAGNLVRANDTTPLVTINQLDPVFVSFSVPEKDLNQIKTYRTSSSFGIAANPPENDKLKVTGQLTFIDNTVDLTTGTIRLKGTFQNPEGVLWPGQFVNVTLTLTTQPDALVVPSRAVQTGQEGPIVYVIEADQTVKIRKVTTGPTIENLTVLTSGVQVGETVVTDGHLRLIPGAKVSVKSDAEPKPGPTPAPK